MNARSSLEARDIVQQQILAALAEKQAANPRLCFKGGTLLRACWAERYRFSEDLDFDWIGQSGDGGKDSVLVFLEGIGKLTGRRYGTECAVRWGAHNVIVDWNSKSLGTGRIKIDVNRNLAKDDLPETKQWELLDRYPGINRSYPLLGYSLPSVVAAKLACISDQRRAKSRDYYDMWRLLEKGDLEATAFVGQFIRRGNLTFDGPAGEAIMIEMLEKSFQAFDKLDYDYQRSRTMGLITDGPNTFEDLLEEWHERTARALDSFDRIVENEQRAQEHQSRQAAIAALPNSDFASAKQTRARCGKPLPIVKAHCTRRKGHPGSCSRERRNG